MNSLIMLKYMYFLSCLTMAGFIVQNKDTLLLQNQFFKENDPENSISFETEMMLFIVFSPLVWLNILVQKLRK